MGDSEKRLIIAFILSVAILFGYQQFAKPQRKALATRETPPQKNPTELYTSDETSKVSSAMADIKEKVSEKEYILETDGQKIAFSNIGAAVRSIVIKVRPGEEEPLISSESPEKRPFSTRSDLLKGLEISKFSVKEENKSLEFVYEEPGYLKVTKRFTPKDDNSITAEITITNISSKPISSSYEMTGPSGIKETHETRGFVEADIFVDGKVARTKGSKTEKTATGMIGWTAIKTKYMAAIMKPSVGVNTAKIAGNAANGLWTKMVIGARTLAPEESTVDTYVFYSGPLIRDRIEPVLGESTSDIMAYGWFTWLGNVLIGLLVFIQKIVKNWGVAIIILTAIVNTITFPLTKTSFTSMHKMKSIQPHIEKLKEAHKSNPQKMNQETMELYKKHNVNPFGGCLPMLLQIPIFISLYQGLMRFIQLKGASFLWIKDLSRPDALPLPVTLPVIGHAVNVLPIAMAVMMFVQQKISMGNAAGMSAEQANQQKTMMIVMPVLFGFLFYKMPSGLVLYWFTNTLLMSAEQYVLAKKLS